MFPTATGLERYEVLRELATNASGATYKAVVRGEKNTVVLRTILPGSGTSLDLALILQNATKTLALNSPYIVCSREAYENNGSVVLVTEYVEGTSLASAICTPRISEWDLNDAARQVCYAIDHASSLNVFHMNVHPGNVIQESDGTIKVLDYGATVDVVRRAEAPPALLQPLHYLSPEQAGGAALDQRSNLFSWGAILYEMVTGTKAFPGDQAQDILDNVKAATPVPAHVAKPGVDPRLSRVLTKALAKLPDERYQTGAEMLHALEHYRDHETEPRKIVAPVAPAVRVVAVPAPALPVVSAATVPPTAKITPTKPALQASTHPVPPPRRLAPTPVSEFLIVGSKPPVPSVPPAKATAPIAPIVRTRPEKSSKRKRWLKPALICAAVAGCAMIATLVVNTWVRGKKISEEARQQIVSQPAVTTEPITEPAAPPETSVPDVIAKAPHSKKDKESPAAFAAPVPISGSVLVQSTPQAAAIEIDGQQVQFATPHRAANLTPGVHTIRLSKAGYETVSRTVQVQPGETTTITVPLPELRAMVSISSDPEGAAIVINGERSGRTTPATAALLKGKYTIALAKQGYLQSESIIEAIPGQNYRISPRLAPLGNADAVKDVGKFKKLFGGGDASSTMGKVQFKTNPKGAQVSINGKAMKKLTPMELLFPAGNYELLITLANHKPVQRTITVKEKSTLNVDVQLEQ